jgi:hypothetical protein
MTVERLAKGRPFHDTVRFVQERGSRSGWEIRSGAGAGFPGQKRAGMSCRLIIRVWA